jgi:hypothetical protein
MRYSPSCDPYSPPAWYEGPGTSAGWTLQGGTPYSSTLCDLSARIGAGQTTQTEKSIIEGADSTWADDLMLMVGMESFQAVADQYAVELRLKALPASEDGKFFGLPSEILPVRIPIRWYGSYTSDWRVSKVLSHRSSMTEQWKNCFAGAVKNIGNRLYYTHPLPAGSDHERRARDVAITRWLIVLLDRYVAAHVAEQARRLDVSGR